MARQGHLSPGQGSALCMALMSLACASGSAPSRPAGAEPGGHIVTREQIAGMNVRNALEVVIRSATHLQIQRTREGSPPRIRHRGVDSLILDPQVLLVIDGSPVSSVTSHLEGIPSESVAFIQILSGREAAVKYGAAAGNGAILVATTAR
jgi:hypothetical protein